VFDRVREDRRKYKTMPAADLVNMAVNETLSRTFLTSSMTLLSILAVLLFGGPVLSGMSIAMIFGIIIGTYSSIFVASAIVIYFGLGFRGKEHNKVEGFQLPQ
jgi:preprotein translocase subunit SecF